MPGLTEETNGTARVSFTSFSNIINGQRRDAEKTYHGINPSTEEPLWEVPVATEQDLEDAVDAATKAYKTWSRTPLEERRVAVKAFAKAVAEYSEEFTELIMTEVGKPKWNAQSEVKGTIDHIESNATFDIPEVICQDDEVAKVVTRYMPIGVVGAILPWNFPLMLCALKVVQSIVTGNTVIAKPSPFTPYTALKLCEIAQRVFPPGVYQVLGGSDSLGPWIVDHPKIPKISFTGSVATGRKVQMAGAKYLKRVSLELGGNDPTIIFPDIDIPTVAKQVAVGIFFNSGQACIALKRIYVHKSIYDSFLSALTSAASSLAVGPPTDTSSFIGPVQNAMQFNKVKDLYKDSKEKGYTFALGDGSAATSHKSGYFLPPTIISSPPDDSRIVLEEPFGPIVPCLPWDDEEEVLERANGLETGLGASVFCKDQVKAEKIAGRLEAGMVWVNSAHKPLTTGLFAGVKSSGQGGEGGPLGLLNFCNAKTIYLWR